LSESIAEPSDLRPIRKRRAGAPLIQTRELPGMDGHPALELLEGYPEGEPVGPPLLFVNGAFAGSWIWREVFLPTSFSGAAM
jgi:hypothetical protein